MPRFSFKTGIDGSGWSDIAECWRVAEELEVFDAGWVNDHFQGLAGQTEPTFEPFSALSALAAQTTRLRLGLLVGAISFRTPILIAKQASTIDRLSGGRFELGIGAGWMEREHTDYGIDFLPVGKRMDRFEEAAIVIRSLLRSDRTSFSGEYFEYTQAPSEPKPIQKDLPIVIGGPGEKRTIPIAARHADHYNFVVNKFKEDTPALFAHKIRVLDEAIAEAGRQPGEVERSVQIVPNRTAEMAVDLGYDFIAAGADHIIYFLRPPLDPKMLESLAEELAKRG